MKLAATGLLVLMAALFAATRVYEDRYPWLSFVKAFAEAAMVGGLADWFAVTALFRHPLGLPIPHTAIIPRNKDRIGEALATFALDRGHFRKPRRRTARWDREGGGLVAHPVDGGLTASRPRSGFGDQRRSPRSHA